MSSYDLHYNFDDVFLRNIVVGFMNLMHESIRWDLQTGRAPGDRREVRVPFYFSTTGSERYLQDKFLNDIVSDPAGEKAEGPYNQIPRGVCNMSGLTILSNEVTNKYIRVDRTKMQEDGTLKTFSVETFWVPIEIEFDTTVYVDSMVDQLKCLESAIGVFYKNRAFQVDLTSMRIPALAYFPDEMTAERTFEFKFDDKKSYTVKFPVHVKTALPVFADSTEMFKGNSIQGFTTSTTLAPRGGIPPAPGLLGNVSNDINGSGVGSGSGTGFGSGVSGGPTATQGGVFLPVGASPGASAAGTFPESVSVTVGPTAPQPPSQGDVWPERPSTPLPPNGGEY